MNESQVKEEKVVIPEEHLKVINDTDIVLQQFSSFMNGEKTKLVINSEAEYVNAAAVITAVKLHKKNVLASKEVVVVPLYDVYKDTLAKFTPVIARIDDKISALESAGRVFREYVKEEARKKQVEEDRKAAEERKKAEDKAEAERKKADAYREIGRDDLANNAEVRAQVAEDKASITVAQIVTPNIPKNTRGSFNTTARYSARILRVEALLEHFKASCPPDVLEAAQKWANAQARAAKGTKSLVPGVEFITE